LRWRIYYRDGSTFGNSDGPPEDAPGAGVIAVAQEDALVGVQVHHQRDFYAFSEDFGGWCGLDEFGLSQYLARPGLKILKLGDNMSTREYLDLIARIHKNPDLPNKSARYSFERKVS
jgi:hypothetical protein